MAYFCDTASGLSGNRYGRLDESVDVTSSASVESDSLCIVPIFQRSHDAFREIAFQLEDFEWNNALLREQFYVLLRQRKSVENETASNRG